MDIDWSQGVSVNIGPWQLGLTEPSPETTGYWEGVSKGELRIKRCDACGQVHHPRRILCWRCGETGMTWIRAAGTGSVYTFSTVHRAPNPDFQDETPYTVGIVMLDEGVPLFTRFLHDAEEDTLMIGAPVTVTFGEVKGTRLPLMEVLSDTSPNSHEKTG